MKTSSKLIVLTFLMGGLMSGAARAQGTNKGSAKVKPASAQPVNSDDNGKRPDSEPSSGPGGGNQPERPERSENSKRFDASDLLKKLLDNFKQAQNRFVEEQKELRQRLKEATDDDRARIRNEIQTKRLNFIDQQREAHDEIRRRLIDLKDRLKDHRDVLDAAKEETKDKAKDRKGGGD